MSFKMQRVHVFHAEVEDKPGGISGKLKKLAEAGAHLEYVYSQRSATKAGHGRPVRRPAARQQRAGGGQGGRAARGAASRSSCGWRATTRPASAAALTQAWEMAGINLHGLVMSVIGGKFIGYATFDSVADANKAATILAELGTA